MQHFQMPALRVVSSRWGIGAAVLALALAAPLPGHAQGAEASEDQSSTLQSPRPALPKPDLRPLRLSVSLSAADVFFGGLAAASMFVIADDLDADIAAGTAPASDQKWARAVGGIHVVFAVADLGWMLHSAVAFKERKHHREKPLDLTVSRMGTGFASANSAVWLNQILVSSFLFTDNRALAATNITISSVLLGLHLWGLVVSAKELKTRKHGRETSATSRRMQPIPGGFTF
jgi:hypothetical protein